MRFHGRFISLTSLCLLLLSLTSQNAIARNTIEVEHFVQGCAELIGIYENKDKERFLAAQTTSLSEALRAGYCRGVIDQYKQQNRHSCRVNWFEIASYVSQQASFANKYRDIYSLLEIGCNE